MRLEVVGVGFVPPFLAVGNGWEALLDGSIADIKRRVRCCHADPKFESVVLVNQSGNVVLTDHPYTSVCWVCVEVLDVFAGLKLIKPLELHQFLG